MVATCPVFHEDFSEGLAIGARPPARWCTVSAGPYTAADGIATISAAGLRVTSKRRNGYTGEPTFTSTVAPDPAGLPGTLDHVKWMAHTTQVASAGYPGFDASPGTVLSLRARVRGRTYGTRRHPFGPYVTEPQADPRLAAGAVNWRDAETGLIFGFFLTSRRLFAYYERLGAVRGVLGRYAAFSYLVPAAARAPGQWHDLVISYDRSAGVVRWRADGTQCLLVDRIGHHLASREHLVLDHGGTESLVSPGQLNCGMGLYTMLDATWPGAGGDGLVRICAEPDYYYDPVRGEPHLQRFADPNSLLASRLFGQGAELAVARMTVSTAPASS
jgi:hypothetical protein